MMVLMGIFQEQALGIIMNIKIDDTLEHYSNSNLFMKSISNASVEQILVYKKLN